MVILRITAGHVSPALLPNGIRAAIPIVAFWTVTGLGSIASAPIDRRGSWLFNVIVGRPGPGHIAGVRIWITLWALLVSLTTVVVLHVLSPASMRTPTVTMGQILVATGLSLIVADIQLYRVRTIPFTHLRISSITDFPMMIARYLVFFPFFVFMVVHEERWIEASVFHLLVTAILIAIVHLSILRRQAESLEQSTLDTPLDEGDEVVQRLGLCAH
jgi:hypothetical protein